MYLSVIVPVHNEERFIGQTLEALVRQDYPSERYEVLVVDGGSTDGTRRVVERFIADHPSQVIRLLDNPGRLSSRARNIGVQEARGRLIAVIDGHVHIPSARLFAAMERHKEAHDALCLARPAPLEVPGLDLGKPYWIAVARKTWLGHSRKSYIYRQVEGFVDPLSSGFAYDRSVFQRSGYFDECFDAAEDLEFHHRLKLAGIAAYTAPDLTIYSYPRETLWALFHQQMRYGEGRARFFRKHGLGSREVLAPPAIFLFFSVLPLAVVLSRSAEAGGAYLAAVLAYWLLLLGTGFRAALHRKAFFPGLLVALAIWTTHMALGWGFLKFLCGLSRRGPGPLREREPTSRRRSPVHSMTDPARN